MRIGIPRESKQGERRVGLDPGAVVLLASEGHDVRIAAGAGAGIGAGDEAYRAAGASIVPEAEAWRSELVVKVKEVQPAERHLLDRNATLFFFQQLVGNPGLARDLAARGVTAIAYELVRDAQGGFPILAPMSVIAGRLAIQVGAHFLTLPAGGNGTLLAGCPGAEPARVLVLGAGHAGVSAADVAAALGAKVTLLTRSPSTRDAVASRLGTSVDTGLATPEAVAHHAPMADLVIGAVLVPGTATPKLLPRSLVSRMKPGSVIVDICIDGGGIAETSRPTTHADPVFVEEGVLHYCVPNMPSAVARTAAAALCLAALPFVRELAGKGIARALRENAGLRAAVLLWRGRVTDKTIASETGLPFNALEDRDLA